MLLQIFPNQKKSPNPEIYFESISDKEHVTVYTAAFNASLGAWPQVWALPEVLERHQAAWDGGGRVLNQRFPKNDRHDVRGMWEDL